MTTLIVPYHDLIDVRRIIDAATQIGWKIIRWSDKIALNHGYIDDDSACDWVYYGSILEADQVMRQVPLALLEPPFDWLAQIPWDSPRRCCLATDRP